MDWQVAQRDWPNGEYSRLVDCRPHLWHVQEAGSGPLILLLHGAGGATQSWRDLFPILARDFRVVAMDLPGQGLTRLGSRHRCGLDAVSEDLLRLCDAQSWIPKCIVGHSAGAAVALRMAELSGEKPDGVVGLNAALGSFEGLAGWLFPVLAKALAMTPFAPALFARMSGSAGTVRALLSSTGSRIDSAGVACYTRLVQDRDHIDGTLLMMAQWKLDGLLARLPELDVPVLLVVGERDKTVPPETSHAAVRRMQGARVVALPDLGHLAHEEAPECVARLIREFVRDNSL